MSIRHLVIALMLSLGLSLGAGPLLAQETAPTEAAQGEQAAGEHGAEGDHGEGAHGEGEHDVLPQLDVRTFPSQIVWLIISFAVLYWLMKSKALPRVAEILEARQDRIANDLDKAAMFRRDAEKALEEYEAAVSGAQADAQAQLREVHEQISAEMAERERRLTAELDEKIDKAEAEIRTAREQALAEVDRVALETARLATSKLTGIEVSESEAQDALARAQQEAA